MRKSGHSAGVRGVFEEELGVGEREEEGGKDAASGGGRLRNFRPKRWSHSGPER